MKDAIVESENNLHKVKRYDVGQNFLLVGLFRVTPPGRRPHGRQRAEPAGGVAGRPGRVVAALVVLAAAAAAGVLRVVGGDGKVPRGGHGGGG